MNSTFKLINENILRDKKSASSITLNSRSLHIVTTIVTISIISLITLTNKSIIFSVDST